MGLFALAITSVLVAVLLVAAHEPRATTVVAIVAAAWLTSGAWHRAVARKQASALRSCVPSTSEC